jgi:hypothetical protein
MRHSAILMVLAALLSAGPAAAQKIKNPIETVVILDGECDFRINDQKLECEGKLIYTKFANHRVAFTGLPTILAGVDFSGAKDVQPVPESYMLTVDRLILSGGTIVAADGFCSMETSTDAQRVYKVECKALGHDGRRFEFRFIPTAAPPVIKHFD